jgi:DNA polymerase IIIc chi subunit
MTSQPLSSEHLLQAVTRLSPEELDAFVDRVIALRASMHVPHTTHTEAELLQQINATLPTASWDRYRVLIALRQQEQLGDAEYDELLQLGDAIEVQHAQRMQALSELAALRGQTLDLVMSDLGIKPVPYA